MASPLAEYEYRPSAVRHAPSDSTSTSSTLEGVFWRMSAKKLRVHYMVSVMHNQSAKEEGGREAHPSMMSSRQSSTFSHTGHSQVVVCCITAYHDSASKHCECVHFADRHGLLMRMKLSCTHTHILK